MAAYRRQARLAVRKPSQLIPENTVAGNALTIVVAIMCFLACLTLGVGDAGARRLARMAGGHPARGHDPGPADRRPRHRRRSRQGGEPRPALPRRRQRRGPTEEESAALLEPWLGTGLDLSDLPVPRLIVVRLSDPTGVDLAELGRRIKAQVPGATLDDHRAWTSRIETMAGATVLSSGCRS